MQNTDPTDLVMFFGRMHPVVVHLPIGFLIALTVLEVARIFKRFRGAAEARTILLFLLVLSSIAAVVFGLMLAEVGGYNEDLLAWHKWMGIGLAGGCIATAIAFWSGKKVLYVLFFLVTLGLLIPSTHFGGSITHGSDYLIAHAPKFIRDFARGPSEATTQPVVAVSSTQPAGAAKPVAFASVVQPVVTEYCIACHGPEKTKGDLRLDSYDAILKGGSSGPAIVAGKPNDSLMLQRMLLPVDDEDGAHMPPEGKPQPSQDQLLLVKWWIESGASSDKTINELAPSDDVKPLLVKVLGEGAMAAETGEAAPTTSPAPAVASSQEPQELSAIASTINELAKSLRIVIEPVALDQPWLAVNASNAKPFGDEQLAQLKPIATNIATLNLAGTTITDKSLAIVAEMPNLRHLRLERTAVTDAGMEHLVGLQQLDYLNLYGTEITGEGLEPLEELSSLRQIYLWRTKVEPEAATAFAAAMTDQLRISQLKAQIAELEDEIRAEQIEVVQGFTAPASQPATAPAADTAVAAAPPAAPPADASGPKPPAKPVEVALANTICPVSGKPIDPTKFIDLEGKRIAFCCDNCPKIFQADPAKFKDKLAAAPAEAAAEKPASKPVEVALANTVCPVSGKPIDPAKFIDFEGKRIAFCCDNCPKAFQADSAKFKDKLK